MMNNFIDSPIFICGHPKAGTSLLASLLDGHPQIVAYPEEAMFFRRFLPAVENASFPEKLKLAEKLLIHIFEWNLENPPDHQKNYPDRDYSDISFEAVRAEMVRNIPENSEDPADYLNAAILGFGTVTDLISNESKYWLEKTPYNEYHTDKIFNWWKNAKCIHIVRDPRGNYHSYERKHPDWSAKKFAMNWVRSTNAGISNMKIYGKDRYLMIRFHDLLMTPEDTMRKITDFLDIRLEDSLFEPTRVGESWRGNSMFSDKFQQISTKPVSRWENQLSVFDQAIIEAICGNLMKRLNFPILQVNTKELTFSQRLDIWKEKILGSIF